MRNLKGVSIATFILGIGVFAATLFAATKTATIPIKGMMCQGCLAKIEAALKKIDGVQAVKASFEQRSVEVTYDDSKVTIEQLHKAIRKAGFKVEGCEGSCCTKDAKTSAANGSNGCCGSCGSAAKSVARTL